MITKIFSSKQNIYIYIYLCIYIYPFSFYNPQHLNYPSIYNEPLVCNEMYLILKKSAIIFKFFVKLEIIQKLLTFFFLCFYFSYFGYRWEKGRKKEKQKNSNFNLFVKPFNSYFADVFNVIVFNGKDQEILENFKECLYFILLERKRDCHNCSKQPSIPNFDFEVQNFHTCECIKVLNYFTA